MKVGARAGQAGGFGRFFLVRKADGAVVGGIGASLDRVSATAQVGYTVVEPCWGRGHATEGWRRLPPLGTRDASRARLVWWSAREALIKRGVEVDEVIDISQVKYAGFRDPDGNTWLLQEFPPAVRQPGQSFYQPEN